MIKKIKLSNFDYMLASLVGYDLFYTLGPVMLPKLIYNVIQLMFGATFVICFIKEKKSISYLDSDIKIVLRLFIVWSIIIVTYGLLTDFSVRLIMLYVVQPTTMLIYITPCFMLIKYDKEKIAILAKWLFVNIIVGLLFYFALRNKIDVSSLNDISVEGNVSFFSYLNIAQYPSHCFLAASFLFIYGAFKTKWKMWLLWFAFAMAIISALLLGRRSSAAVPVGVLLAKVFYDFYHRPKMLFGVLILLFAVYVGYDYLEEKFLSTFVILQDRAFDNTRYWVEHDFYRDMHGLDYIVGRGSNGLVYSSELGRRNIIETGYLNMILHGGVIYLFMYLYLLVVSAIRGLLSRNKILIAMSLFIFIRVACLYPGGHLSFSMITMALWACVSICSSRKHRKSLPRMKL